MERSTSWLESRSEGMDEDEKNETALGACHMCLAIPGKIVEISSSNPESATVDVVGVRRKVDLGLLEEDRPVPGDFPDAATVSSLRPIVNCSRRPICRRTLAGHMAKSLVSPLLEQL